METTTKVSLWDEFANLNVQDRISFDDWLDRSVFPACVKIWNAEGLHIPGTKKNTELATTDIRMNKNSSVYFITFTGKGDNPATDEEMIRSFEKLIESKQTAVVKYLACFEHHKEGQLHFHVVLFSNKVKLDSSKLKKFNDGRFIHMIKVKPNGFNKIVNYILKERTKDGIDERVSPYGYRSVFSNFDFTFKFKKHYNIYNTLTETYFGPDAILNSQQSKLSKEEILSSEDDS